MKKMNSEKTGMQSEQLSVFRLFLAGMVLLIAYILSGCSVYTALPVTLQELKHYVVEQEESYPQSLRPVVQAAVCSLHQLKFKLDRIEISDNLAYIAAFWGKTQVKLKFSAITPNLTRVESRMTQKDTWRDYASEDELFSSIRRTLDDTDIVLCTWQRAVRGMIPLLNHPESGAAIIAYQAPGSSISISKIESLPPGWVAISLRLDGFAYLEQKNYSLQPVVSKDQSTGGPF
ncbi:MAG: hypothetical protein J7M09_03355 [Deltaproteobacteria bacterium]|nr:hypothetical protein [Candidatus Tharpella sp.]